MCKIKKNVSMLPPSVPECPLYSAFVTKNYSAVLKSSKLPVWKNVLEDSY